MKIGFFDSGLGGLTILKAVSRELPQYDYVYYGDTAHLPYGGREEDDIYKLTKQGVEHLIDKGCGLIIIACNTASAETTRRLQTEFTPACNVVVKILGIIIPTVETLLELRPQKALLIGTQRTIQSNKYQLELTKKTPDPIYLQQLATPELVPLIELDDLPAATIQAISLIEKEESTVVILGCTHYTQIKNQLRDHFAGRKQIISQDEIIPTKLKLYLQNHPELESKLSNTGERSVHLTRHRSDYDLIIKQFLGGVFVDE